MPLKVPVSLAARLLASIDGSAPRGQRPLDDGVRTCLRPTTHVLVCMARPRDRYSKACPMKRRANLTREQAEGLAIQALAFIAGNSERLGRFLGVTGIEPADIRTAAREPGFLVGVLDYMASDEQLIGAFAREADLDATDIERGRAVLGGGTWEREVP